MIQKIEIWQREVEIDQTTLRVGNSKFKVNDIENEDLKYKIKLTRYSKSMLTTEGNNKNSIFLRRY